MPLYPHYAMSSYETVVVKTMSQIRERGHPFRTTLLKPFMLTQIISMPYMRFRVPI